MTIQEFYRIYPVSKIGIAKMLGHDGKWIYNLLSRNEVLSGEQLQLFNYCLKELSYQLGKVYIHNSLIYIGRCRFCNKDFKVIDEGSNSLFYSMNGLVCSSCIKNPDCQKSIIPTPYLPGMA